MREKFQVALGFAMVAAWLIIPSIRAIQRSERFLIFAFLFLLAGVLLAVAALIVAVFA